jgi:hypothetical protein
MCGYPGKKRSMSLRNEEHSGIKLQPVIQRGLVSEVLPINNCNYPYGVQTNIVGTGSSSGSPIVDSNGEVLGIAQGSIFGHTPLNMKIWRNIVKEKFTQLKTFMPCKK